MSLPEQRLSWSSHGFFPFDLFDGKAPEGLVEQELLGELHYVRDHCMMPPYPWGQIFYSNYLINNIFGKVPGDLAELGIGQGGSSIFFARLAKKYGRKFLAIDSFEGLPPPTGQDNPYFLEGDYRPKAGQDNYENFLRYKERFDVDDTLTVVKGFFSDAEIPPEFESFSFVHLDSDLYSSMYDSLQKVWHRVSVGGCVVVDDFFHHCQGPARAVSDFFRSLGPGVEPPLCHVIPTYAVMIVKGQSPCLRWQERADGSGRVPIMETPRALDGNFYSFDFMRSCEPFVRAAEKSVERVAQALASATPEQVPGLTRIHLNAQNFLAFLRYSRAGARSGSDVMRYLLPLEDMWDRAQGNLCGLAGVERKTIEIPI